MWICSRGQAVCEFDGTQPKAMSNDDYDTPEMEARWLGEQHASVQRYLDSEEVRHRGVSSDPVWFVAPCISLWTVESHKKAGVIGWWVISGDLPTDYLSGRDARDARSALTAFARRWREVSGYMLRGRAHPTIRLGHTTNQKELGDLLRRRAEILQSFVDDDAMW